MSPDPETLQQDASLDLGTLLSSVWNRRWFVLALVVLSSGVALAASFLVTPVYRAETIAVPADTSSSGLGMDSALSQFAGLAALAGVSVDSDGTSIEETLAVLRSREFTERFIADEGLMHVLLADRGNREPTLLRAFKVFDRDVRSIARDSRSGLVSVQIEWHDPVVAAEWANKLVERLNAEMRSRAIAKTNASVEFLEKELAATPLVETRLAIGRLWESQVNQRMVANVTKEYALRVVDRALPPDEEEPIRPRRLFLAVASGAVAFLVAVLICVARPARRSRVASVGA